VALSWEWLGSLAQSARVVASTVSGQLWLGEREQRRGKRRSLGKVRLSVGEPYMS
jgi:hypothetical protein